MTIILIVVALFLIKKGLHLESFLLLTGTSAILYPIVENVIFLDVYFILYLIFFLKKVHLTKIEIVGISLLLICAFIPSVLNYNISSILQPLRLFQIIFIYLIFSKALYKKQHSLKSTFITLIFLSVTSILLNVSQIFDISSFVYEIKPLVSYTTGGWFIGSGQMGPFYLILFMWVYYSGIFNGKKQNTLVLLFSLNIILSSNRTTLFIFLIILLTSSFKNISLAKTIIFFFFTFLYYQYIEILTPKVYNTFVEISKFNFQIDTLFLRQKNWAQIFSFFENNCSVLFGCGYNLIEEKSMSLKTTYGVFTFDNMYLRLLVEGGVFALSIKLFIYLRCLIRANLNYVIPLCLLGISQETIEDPIILMPTLILLFNNLKYDL